MLALASLCSKTPTVDLVFLEAYTCGSCGIQFQFYSNLMEHMQSHAGESPPPPPSTPPPSSSTPACSYTTEVCFFPRLLRLYTLICMLLCCTNRTTDVALTRNFHQSIMLHGSWTHHFSPVVIYLGVFFFFFAFYSHKFSAWRDFCFLMNFSPTFLNPGTITASPAHFPHLPGSTLWLASVPLLTPLHTHTPSSWCYDLMPWDRFTLGLGDMRGMWYPAAWCVKKESLFIMILTFYIIILLRPRSLYIMNLP